MKTILLSLCLCASVVTSFAAPAPTQAKSVSQLAGELRREVAIAQAETAEAKKNVSRLQAEISDAYSWGMNEQKAKLAAQAEVKALEAKLKRKQFGWGVAGFFLAVVILVGAGIFLNRRQETVIVAAPPPDTGSGPGEPATNSPGPTADERAGGTPPRAQGYERAELTFKLAPKKKSRTARRSVPTK